jgi:hypothetical protein
MDHRKNYGGFMTNKPKPIIVDSKDIRVVGFISRKSNEWIICADIPGYPKSGWYDIPVMKEQAVAMASERGISLPDLADILNGELRQAEDTALEASGLPNMRFSGVMTPEMATWFKDLIAGDE